MYPTHNEQPEPGASSFNCILFKVIFENVKQYLHMRKF